MWVSSFSFLCLSHSNTTMPFKNPTQASSAGPALPVSHDWVFTYGRRCCGHMWVEKVDTALISLSLSSKQATQLPDAGTREAHSKGISPRLGSRREPPGEHIGEAEICSRSRQNELERDSDFQNGWVPLSIPVWEVTFLSSSQFFSGSSAIFIFSVI